MMQQPDYNLYSVGTILSVGRRDIHRDLRRFVFGVSGMRR
jgi:hypothetical protein